MVPSAVLPNPAEPGLVGFGAVLGAVFARTAAWALGYDEDKGIRWAADGSYYGAGIALAAYLIFNFLEVGFHEATYVAAFPVHDPGGNRRVLRVAFVE